MIINIKPLQHYPYYYTCYYIVNKRAKNVFIVLHFINIALFFLIAIIYFKYLICKYPSHLIRFSNCSLIVLSLKQLDYLNDTSTSNCVSTSVPNTY